MSNVYCGDKLGVGIGRPYTRLCGNCGQASNDPDSDNMYARPEGCGELLDRDPNSNEQELVTGELFSVEKSSSADKFKFDFELFIIGDFDAVLPNWFGRAVVCVWSWWDGRTNEDAGNQVCYRLSDALTKEQRASIKRLLRRAARISKRGIMPTFDPACLARCERAFAA